MGKMLSFSSDSFLKLFFRSWLNLLYFQEFNSCHKKVKVGTPIIWIRNMIRVGAAGTWSSHPGAWGLNQGQLEFFLAFSSLPGIILSKSSSHLDFVTVTKISSVTDWVLWLHFAVDYIKFKTKTVIPSRVSPKDVLTGRVSSLDDQLKEFDVSGVWRQWPIKMWTGEKWPHPAHDNMTMSVSAELIY